MSITFCFGVSSNLSLEKSPTAEILGKYFLRTIVPRKCMCKISAVGLFCCNKFEETPKQTTEGLFLISIAYYNIANRLLNSVRLCPDHLLNSIQSSKLSKQAIKTKPHQIQYINGLLRWLKTRNAPYKQIFKKFPK